MRRGSLELAFLTRFVMRQEDMAKGCGRKDVFKFTRKIPGIDDLDLLDLRWDDIDAFILSLFRQHSIGSPQNVMIMQGQWWRLPKQQVDMPEFAVHIFHGKGFAGSVIPQLRQIAG